MATRTTFFGLSNQLKGSVFVGTERIFKRGVGVLFALGATMSAVAYADEAAQARFHDDLARAHYDAGRFEDAVREFFLEQRLAPNPRVIFNIALCFDQLGRANQAFFYFSEYLASKDEERRAFALSAIERLKPQVAQVRISSDPPGADIFIDLKEHGSYGKTPLVVPLEAGRHVFWITKAGHREQRVELTARRGKQTETSVTLTPVLGRLRVETSTGAEVLVADADGRTVVRGPSPLDAQLAPAIYVVSMSGDGYRPRQDLVRVSEDEVNVHRATLERLPPTARVTVTANVPGAVVALDGVPRGFAPTVLTELEAGEHEIQLDYTDLAPWSGRFDVARDSSGYLTATLEAPQRTTRDVSTWIIGGLGVAALVAAVPTIVAAGDKRSEFDRAFETNPNATNLALVRSEGQTLNAVADGLWIGGAVALVTSVVLYFVTERQTPPSTATLTWD